MKRFDNFLRLLLGLLVTQIIRDHHVVTGELSKMFSGSADWVAELFPYALFMLFMRNTHASIAWDEMLDKSHFEESLTTSVGLRAIRFVVTVFLHVAMPLAILDTLSGHTETNAGRRALTTVLYLPFALYFVWDVYLFFASDAPAAGSSSEVLRVVLNWIKVGAWGLVGGTLLSVHALYVHFSRESAQDLYLLEGFMILVVITVVGDYWLNREFYFPAVQPSQ